MGQFLAIGLATKIRVQKEDLDNSQLNIKQLQEKMEQALHYVPEIYVVSEHEDVYDFLLNDSIFHTQLLPLLNTFYPLLYDQPVY